MKLGMQLGYDDPIGSVALAQEADRLGFHSVWTSEAWGADAVTVASWIAATTEQIGIGTAIMQMPARTPATTAMTVATLDQLSGGRVLLGLGTSGPQVVEGLARRPLGQAARPDARVRRDRPRRATPRDDRAPRRPLRHPVQRRGRDRARQAAEDDPEAAPPRGARSTSPRSARRTSRSRPRSPTAGCRSSSRRTASARSTGRRSRTRPRTSRSRRSAPCSSTTTSRPAATC